MASNYLNWLDLAEYLSIAITIVTIIIGLISGHLVYTFIPLSILLILNIIHRFRLEKLSQRRLAIAIKQLQESLDEKIAELEEKIKHKSVVNNISKVEGKTDESIARLQESLQAVIEYLNRQNLADRVLNLEQTLAGNYSIKSENEAEEIVVKKEAESLKTNWKYITNLKSHRESVSGLAISSDGKLLCSVSWDQTLKLWDLETGNLLDSIVAHSQGLLAVSFTGNDVSNYAIATGSFDQTIKIWSLDKKNNQEIYITLEKTLTHHTGSIHALGIAEEKQILVSGSYDQTIKQWDLRSKEKLHSSYDELGAIAAIAINEAKELIAAGGGDGTVSLWQLGSGEMTGYLEGNISSVESLAISADGKMIAAGCADGSIKIWLIDSNQLNPSLIILAHSGQVKSVAFSCDTKSLYSGGGDGKILIWNAYTGELIARIQDFSDNPKRILSMILSADNKLLAVGNVEGDIKIWLQE